MTKRVMAASRSSEPTVSDDPRDHARDARLRYVSDTERGFGRRRRGPGFSYHEESGATITDPHVRERIEGLVIPPAWRDVWICRDTRGHLQATGRDEAGRKQYIYHPRWREVRDRVKFDHLVTFAEALPKIRRRLRRDLRDDPLSRRRVTAAIVKLMDTTLVRVGNTAYARENGSYGLTTLRQEHVRANGDELALAFEGKGGARHELNVRDQTLAAVVRECQEIDGYELFRYLDADGVTRTVDSSDVNDYLREAAQREVTAKDFRTWGGTVLTARALHGAPAVESVTGRKRTLVAAVRATAVELGNTAAVTRRAYVHPSVIEAYLGGSFGAAYTAALEAARRRRARELRLHEGATLHYLRANAESST